MSVNIRFLDAADTVTGSKYLVEHDRQSLLIDCGLFQGFKQLRLRNREPLPMLPSDIGAVLLTHAQIDHSGYLPLLVKEGFRGKGGPPRPRAISLRSSCPTAATFRKPMPTSPTATVFPNTRQPCRSTPKKTRSAASSCFPLCWASAAAPRSAPSSSG
ncbi:MAG: glyoxylase-like metal-dependent hydrolase (beta-lactamase superfamily II) [Hydrogenophaga sp.]|jgi:glyoxylase-like metal-dependent hydrolase (beta-lactamase superfamily II)